MDFNIVEYRPENRATVEKILSWCANLRTAIELAEYERKARRREYFQERYRRMRAS